jgi:hypothetical protein
VYGKNEFKEIGVELGAECDHGPRTNTREPAVADPESVPDMSEYR